MKYKRLSSLLIVIIMILGTFLSTSNISFAAAMEGNGTEKSPYLIRTVSDLYRIPDNPAAYYTLMNDIDLGNVERNSIAPFTGVLEGNGFKIKNLRINNELTDNVGLFSQSSKAKIMNLILDGVTIDVNTHRVGALVGYLRSSEVVNCSVINSNIKGKQYVGGMIGDAADSNIYQCFTIGDVSSYGGFDSGIVGGLCGIGANSVFTQCYSDSNVYGDTYIGGIIGTNWTVNEDEKRCTIKDSYASGTINGSDSYAAGIYSLKNAIIENCYAVSRISSKRPAGLSHNGTPLNSYFDKQKVGVTTPQSQARTTEQMYQKSNYKGWDFDNVWYIEEGKDYPKLRFALTIPLKKLELQPNKAELSIGERLTIVPIYTPANATNKNLTWFSSDPSVVRVDGNGAVYAAAIGYSSIVAISEDGSHVAYCYITVKQNGGSNSDNIALEGTASSNSVLDENYSANNANDGDLETKWLAGESDYGIYLQIDFKQVKALQKIKIKEMDHIVNEFALQIWKSSKWVDIYTGNTIGEAFELNFEPITTDKVRLMLYSYLNGECPSIHEFEIYN